MASTTEFSKYPPFPEDTRTANLSKISLAKISAGDAEESNALFESCRTVGFFLLDLSGNELGENFITDIDATFQITKKTMDLPEEEKMKYHAKPPERLVGYKSLGFMKTETKQPDRCEFFMLLQDEINELNPSPGYPSPISTNLSALKSYLSHAQPILELICRVLATSLKLPKDAFYSKQEPSSKSGTMIRLIKYPAATSDDDRRTSLVAHTDMGTITLLATVLGGLQILPPSSEEWVHIKPEPNCLVVNIGDAMVQWTGGVLRSNVHRVTFAPGAQGEHDRYSVAFLVRASAQTYMRRMKGGLIPDAGADEEDEGEITASEWEKKKNLALIQGKDCVKSTGGRPLKWEQ